MNHLPKICQRAASLFAIAALLGVLGACSSVAEQQVSPVLSRQASWVQLPLANLAESPRAAERAEAILATLLRARGVARLTSHSEWVPQGEQTLLQQLDDASRQREALARASDGRYRYAITGSVDEWGYKRGLDGEPAVGISLRVVDLSSGMVVWSASGARTGWGYESAAGTANKLLVELLEGLNLTGTQ
jgi:hypothetical protein